MPQQQEQLDIVRHPRLGELKFPKSMPFDERNRLIEELERKPVAPQQQFGPEVGNLADVERRTNVLKRAAVGAAFGVPALLPKDSNELKSLLQPVAKGIDDLTGMVGETFRPPEGGIETALALTGPVGPALLASKRLLVDPTVGAIKRAADAPDASSRVRAGMGAVPIIGPMAEFIAETVDPGIESLSQGRVSDPLGTGIRLGTQAAVTKGITKTPAVLRRGRDILRTGVRKVTGTEFPRTETLALDSVVEDYKRLAAEKPLAELKAPVQKAWEPLERFVDSNTSPTPVYGNPRMGSVGLLDELKAAYSRKGLNVPQEINKKILSILDKNSQQGALPFSKMRDARSQVRAVAKSLEGTPEGAALHDFASVIEKRAETMAHTAGALDNYTQLKQGWKQALDDIETLETLTESPSIAASVRAMGNVNVVRKLQDYGVSMEPWRNVEQSGLTQPKVPGMNLNAQLAAAEIMPEGGPEGMRSMILKRSTRGGPVSEVGETAYPAGQRRLAARVAGQSEILRNWVAGPVEQIALRPARQPFSPLPLPQPTAAATPQPPVPLNRTPVSVSTQPTQAALPVEPVPVTVTPPTTTDWAKVIEESRMKPPARKTGAVPPEATNEVRAAWNKINDAMRRYEKTGKLSKEMLEKYKGLNREQTIEKMKADRDAALVPPVPETLQKPVPPVKPPLPEQKLALKEVKDLSEEVGRPLTQATAKKVLLRKRASGAVEESLKKGEKVKFETEQGKRGIVSKQGKFRIEDKAKVVYDASAMQEGDTAMYNNKRVTITSITKDEALVDDGVVMDVVKIKDLKKIRQ